MATVRACGACCVCDMRGERCCVRLPTWRGWRTLVKCLAGGRCCCTCSPSPSTPPHAGVPPPAIPASAEISFEHFPPQFGFTLPAIPVTSEIAPRQPLATPASEITQPGFTLPAISIPSEITHATSASQITSLVATEAGVTPTATPASVITLEQLETDQADARSASEITLEQVGDIISILEAELNRLDPNTASSSSISQHLSISLSRWGEEKQKFISLIQSMPNEVVKGGKTLVTSLLTKVLSEVGSVHWLGVGLLFIGWSLDNIDNMGKNRDDCIKAFRRSLDLLRSTKQIWEAVDIEGPSKEGVLRSSVEVAVKCAIFCSSNFIDDRMLRFFKAANVKEALDMIGKDLDRAIQQNTEMMLRHNFHPRSLYERQVTFTSGGDDDIVGGQVVIKEAVKYLETISNEIMAICLYGIGGIGKSFLGLKIFTKFQKSKYIDCRVELQLETNDGELCDVQRQILEKVCKNPSPRFSNLSDGIEIMQKEFKKITNPIFLYVDNISEGEHLAALLPKASFFPKGSRILMTSRGENIKCGIVELEIMHEHCKLIEVEKLRKEHARQLLREQFEGEGEPMSIGGVESLEERVLDLCDGLPLALTLVGRYIASEGSKKVEVWHQVVDDMQKGEPFDGNKTDRLYSRIMFTLHKLDPNVQRDFLDMVFFEWRYWGDNRLPWKNMGHLAGTKSLKVLSQRGLVRKTDNGTSEIHDVIRARGRRMIKEHEKELHISGTEEFEEHKKTQKALKKVVALADTTVNACLLEEMKELRFLCSVRVEGECQNVQLRKLRVVRDLRCSTPTVFDWSECADLKELQWGHFYAEDAAPPVSNLEMFKHHKFSMGLEALTFHKWRRLKDVDVIESLTCLKVLRLELCPKIESLPEGISRLTGLKKLSLQGCGMLRALPQGISRLTCLEVLDLLGCESLRSLPEGIQKLQGLKRLSLSECWSLRSLPEGIQELQGLERLNLWQCESLQSLPNGVTSLTGLVELDLGGCKRLKNLPQGIENLRGITNYFVTYLDLGDLRRIKYLPRNITGFTSLKELNLRGSGSLQCLPDGVSGLTGLTSLQLRDCRRLQALPEGIACLRGLEKLDLGGCRRLQELPEGIACLSGLKELDLGGCRTLALQPALPEALSYLTGLTGLGLAGWGSLEALPDQMLGFMTGLRGLNLSGCKTLQFLPHEISQLTGLGSLHLSGCESLQSIEGVTTLTALTTLDVTHCTHLQFLPEGCGTRLTSLREFYLSGCSSIKCIPEAALGQLVLRQRLDLGDCKSLMTLPQSIGRLTHLQSLILENCTSLKSLPKGVTRLSNLHELSFFGCRSLQSLPGGLIGSLTGLRELKLGECAMPIQPLLEEVSCKMTRLEALMLTKCEDLLILPQGISNLVRLKRLSLLGCQNLQILPPEGMGNWKGLKSLELSGCQRLQSLPQQLITLTNLSYLNLSGCIHLQSLPQGTFASLIALESLIMNECVSLQLEEPQGIAMLTCLRSLELSESEHLLSPLLDQGVTTNLTCLKQLRLSRCGSLRALPKGVVALTNLESLDLSKCVSLQSLSNLPEGSPLSKLHLAGCGSLDQPLVWETFCSLKSLEVLCLSGWETMQALPEGIGSLERLRRLDLSSCSNLLTLPKSMTKLEELSYLSLADCKILQSLPRGITRLEDLEHLDLSGCTSLEPLCEDIEIWISSIDDYRPCIE